MSEPDILMTFGDQAQLTTAPLISFTDAPELQMATITSTQ